MKPKKLILSTALSAVALFSTQVGAQTPYGPGYPPQAAPAYGAPSGYSMMGGGYAMPYGPMGPAPGYAAAPMGYQQVMPAGYQDPTMAGDPPMEYEQYAPGQEYGESVMEGSPYGETLHDASCSSCDLPPRVYGSADLLVMWRKSSNLVSILTTSDAVDEGVIGAPTTSTLFGGPEQGHALTGMRITTGLWLDNYQNWSVGGSFLALEREVQGINATSAEFPTLAFPFFNTNTNANASIVVALPGAGNNAADNTTVGIRKDNNFYTGDMFFTKHLYTSHANRVDFVGGYYYARIDDAMKIRAQYTAQDAGGTVPVGTVVNVGDNFLAKNEFNGGEVGLIFDFQDGPFTWRALGKIALGSMHQRMAISGSRQETFGGITDEFNGGIYARDSNIGDYSRDVFCFIPEGQFDLIYALTCNLDLKIGCTYIYVSDVALAQGAVPGTINPSGGDPVYTFGSDDYWALGATFGVDFHY
ncbi:BBP7 family outer membrane beta-barrel protein [Blastopirellula sp. JC732]|uniref:BBP7 family outer membrane beta-barrel protein n=1 Tax=Blastopirellula sediminis TaxID=2894196 RepID=A0A9X1MRA0_9BACT|nr:BBP7 family outer membrane beta-barrel protein [Blastopirellula sediminis]MCC9604613.1 BBP7 family outer membrane beta-barrel protein [Blastopirellula sediminis]MCC9632088.1 BBP7 family outer membrane beta-barrel protein [Blastopirellula sediminis]